MLGIVIALAILVLSVVALMAVPASLVVHVERTVRVRTSWRIGWLFGLVDVRLGRRKLPPQVPTRELAEDVEPGGAKQVPARERRFRSGAGIVLAVVRTPGFIRRVLRLMTDLRRQVECDGLYLRAEFGLDDPADTGRLYGVLAPIMVAATAEGFDVRCRPNFLQPGFEGAGGGRIRARPITLVGLLVGFLCSPPTLRAVRAVWVSRR